MLRALRVASRELGQQRRPKSLSIDGNRTGDVPPNNVGGICCCHDCGWGCESGGRVVGGEGIGDPRSIDGRIEVRPNRFSTSSTTASKRSRRDPRKYRGRCESGVLDEVVDSGDRWVRLFGIRTSQGRIGVGAVAASGGGEGDKWDVPVNNVWVFEEVGAVGLIRSSPFQCWVEI